MPYHFSVGFVVESRPRRSYVNVCAGLNSFISLGARINMISRVRATWSRKDGCYMGCNCGECIKRGNICAPRGDDTRIMFDVYDNEGDEFDISGVTEIVFIVSEGVFYGGNTSAGGDFLIEKRLTTGGIGFAGTDYQFYVDITAADMAAIDKRINYYEVQVTTSAGLKKTVSCGNFTSDYTIIQEL